MLDPVFIPGGYRRGGGPHLAPHPADEDTDAGAPAQTAHADRRCASSCSESSFSPGAGCPETPSGQMPSGSRAEARLEKNLSSMISLAGLTRLEVVTIDRKRSLALTP